MKAPSVQFTSAKVTPGMNMITAKADFDSSESSADYVVYQFTGETLDKDTAEVLYRGTTTYYGRNSLTIHCREKLKEGAKLQIVLTAGEKEAVSNVLEVQPAPDWGTPYAAFEVSAVKSSDKTVDVTVDYADEYLSMGEEFYCDVTIYSSLEIIQTKNLKTRKCGSVWTEALLEWLRSIPTLEIRQKAN